jgi:hypothetical protein
MSAYLGLSLGCGMPGRIGGSGCSAARIGGSGATCVAHLVEVGSVMSVQPVATGNMSTDQESVTRYTLSNSWLTLQHCSMLQRPAVDPGPH